MIDPTVSNFVYPKDYPLPNFVMLEVEERYVSKELVIALVDKKHKNILDCDIWSNLEDIDGLAHLRQLIEDFKRSLKDNGVI